MKTMKHIFSAVTATALLAGSASAADEASSASSIKQLPREGAASVMGTVDSISDSDTFVLRDSDGKTINVDTSAPLNISKGDSVSVKGMVESSMFGMSHKITGASISTMAAMQPSAGMTTGNGAMNSANGSASSTPDTANPATGTPAATTANSSPSTMDGSVNTSGSMTGGGMNGSSGTGQ